jgi:DDB1- and CUL4-associated factor 11
MIHSTMSPIVQMFNVETKKYSQAFNLKTGGSNISDDDYGYWGMRIFSVKLSDDSNEMIAGCGRTSGGAPIQVYDIVANKIKHSITAHSDDINTICYVDKKNTNTFISGSDDSMCKLWDTRILKNDSPVGIFYGHVSGITNVNSREDNLYFCSNSKDQSLKLWDLRKASTERKTDIPRYRYDYRYEPLDQATINRIKETMKTFDESVTSFWGHKVHQTLIRAHFSPEYNTGRRYLYSGSYDGSVYIFDTLTSETASVLEVKPMSNYDVPIVRDCIWHPFAQTLITTNFNGEVHRWDYTDLSNAKEIEKPSYNISELNQYMRGDEDDDVSAENDDDYEEYEEEVDDENQSEEVSAESHDSDWKTDDDN